MKELETLSEYNWLYWAAGLIVLLNSIKWGVSLFDWFVGKLGLETKRTRHRKDMENRLTHVELAVAEIERNSAKKVEMFLEEKQGIVDGINALKKEIVGEFNKLHEKIDKQQEEDDATDRAMLRDRIAGGMRYFSQNKDEDGNVHISFSDYVNLDDLFQRYFAKNGNGPFEDEYKVFKTFVKDR